MDLTEHSGSHHGEPPLTNGDLKLLQAMELWIRTARAAAPDMLKSRLFWRIRSGKQPLPEAPPTAFSCPWYELIEEPDRPHWSFDMWADKERNLCSVAQCMYEPLEWNCNIPTLIRFGSYQFKLWSGNYEKHPGWFIQLIK